MRSTSRPEVVIIGAGFGGLNVALGLAGKPCNVTLIDRRNYHLFQPLLYQVATAGLSPAEISAPIRSVLSRAKNIRVIKAEVTGIDLQKKWVKYSDSQIPYDELVIATGARHSYFGNEAWAKFAPGLKDIPDATEIRKNILLALENAEMEKSETIRRTYLNFVVVGGGPTGVELAGSIAELMHRVLNEDFRSIDPRTARVVLVEAGPRLLAAFPESLSRRAEKDLVRLGVEVKKDTRVTGVNAEGVETGEGFLAAKTVIWAAGVEASPAAKWLGTESDRQGRAFVTDDLTVKGEESVSVIGDTAHSVSKRTGQPLPGVAPVAIQQGNYVARRLLRKWRGKKNQPFKYVDKGNLATIGRSKAVAEIGPFKLKGWIAWVLWATVHILYLIGFRNRLLVVIQWTWSYFMFRRGARLITEE